MTPILRSVLPPSSCLPQPPCRRWRQTTPAPADAAPAAPAVQPAILPDVVMGNADAPVTVIEYASFTCRHCAAFHDENMPKLKADYIDTGKVKFIQRDVYFDQVGLWAGDPRALRRPRKVLSRVGHAVRPAGQVAGREVGRRAVGQSAQAGRRGRVQRRPDGRVLGRSIARSNSWSRHSRRTPAVTRSTARRPSSSTAKRCEPAWDQLKAKIDEKLAAAGTDRTERRRDAACGAEGRRTGAHPGRPLGRPDAGRPGGRGDQGRSPEGDDTRRWGPPFIERDGDGATDARPPISTRPTAASARSSRISARPRGRRWSAT